MIRIGKKILGDKHPCFIIAEIGLAHEGSVGIAKSFIDLISDAGANAVKFQMHIAKEESSFKEKFRKKFSSQDKSRWDYWKRTSFTLKQWKELKNYSEKKKLIFLCSPFSLKAVEILKELNIAAWKIASGEFSNDLLIKKIQEVSKKPLILSTGLSDEKEIKKKISGLNKKNIALLQCTSQYPTEIKNAGHKYIKIFKKKYKCVSGLSDHTGKINSLLTAISYGANIIETHVTFNKKFFGPDTSSSISFEQLNFLCNFSKDFSYIQKSKFSKKKITVAQKKMIKLFTKSLVINKDKKKGEKIYFKDLDSKKPQIGIKISDYKKYIGKKIKFNLSKGTFLKKNHFK